MTSLNQTLRFRLNPVDDIEKRTPDEPPAVVVFTKREISVSATRGLENTLRRFRVVPVLTYKPRRLHLQDVTRFASLAKPS